jgi:hypothetical protein
LENKRAEQTLLESEGMEVEWEREVGQGSEREVAQTMYTCMNNYRNNKKYNLCISRKTNSNRHFSGK